MNDIVPQKVHVTLNILEARQLKAVDSNGYSDPYVKVYQIQQNGKPKQIHKTAVIKKSLNPVYKNETLVVNALGLLEVQIKDQNTFSSVSLGSVELNLADLITDETPSFDGWYPITNGQGEIHISGSVNLNVCDTGSLKSIRSNLSLRKLSSSSLNKH
jgi:Ca2+-dependent lipid-binding protein